MGECPLELFLCGDVMLGRGIDQILPHPGEPTLHEDFARDAGAYVEMARDANGPIPAPVDYGWPWGDVLEAVDGARPHARIINLETAITKGDQFAPGKSIHYRMNPANLPCLSAIRPDACVLANNHVMDFGPTGLLDTCDTLAAAGIASAGAGKDHAAAWAPVVIPLEGMGRVLVFGLGVTSSGVPSSWAAAADRPGVAFVTGLDRAEDVVSALEASKRPGDIVVISIHLGSNWGYGISADQVDFAHNLVDAGVDVVHGHSSHHPRPIEVYRGKLILYGCGDLINDYEGIGGYTNYRPDLRVVYFASLEPGTGELHDMRLVPMMARRMRLWRAPMDDSRWLQANLAHISVGCQIDAMADGELALAPYTGC